MIMKTVSDWILANEHKLFCLAEKGTHLQALLWTNISRPAIQTFYEEFLGLTSDLISMGQEEAERNGGTEGDLSD